MGLKIQKVEVWATQLLDHPGDLGRVLSVIADAGGNLECVIARRQFDKPGTGVIFVSPIKGKKVQWAAGNIGLQPARNLATLRVESSDRTGMGAKICSALGDAGINLRGVSASVIGKKSVVYIGFDNAADVDRAIKVLRKMK